MNAKKRKKTTKPRTLLQQANSVCSWTIYYRLHYISYRELAMCALLTNDVLDALKEYNMSVDRLRSALRKRYSDLKAEIIQSKGAINIEKRKQINLPAKNRLTQ